MENYLLLVLKDWWGCGGFLEKLKCGNNIIKDVDYWKNNEKLIQV